LSHGNVGKVSFLDGDVELAAEFFDPGGWIDLREEGRGGRKE
jgi:hypothetical protein